MQSRTGKTHGEGEADGAFFNLKRPLQDSAGRPSAFKKIMEDDLSMAEREGLENSTSSRTSGLSELRFAQL